VGPPNRVIGICDVTNGAPQWVAAGLVEPHAAAWTHTDDLLVMVKTNNQYRLAVINDQGEVQWWIDCAPEPADADWRVPVGAPSALAASDGTYADEVRLTWDAVAGASGYSVYRAPTNRLGAAAPVGAAAGSPWTDPSAGAGTTYWYWVKATNAFGIGSPGVTDSGFAAGDTVLLVIEGAPARHDSPTPLGYGTNHVAPGAVITNSVTSPADEAGGTRYSCTGWTGDGDVPQQGTGTAVGFTLTTNSTLTWQWLTERFLDVAVTPGGTVDKGDGWYTNGAAVTLQATATGAYVFVGWSGDVPLADTNRNPLTLTMNQPRTVTAQFTIPPAPTNTFLGQPDMNWFNPANWSLGVVPDAGSHVVIGPRVTNVLAASTPYLGSLTVTNAMLLLTNWATVLSASNIVIQGGGTVTHAGPFAASRMSNCVHLVCGTLTVDRNGLLNADGRGYLGGTNNGAGHGPGRGLSATGYGGGGGHGARGASSGYGAAADGGSACGLVASPLGPGSGGGGGGLTNGASGGGVIWIEAAGWVTVDGTLSASATTNPPRQQRRRRRRRLDPRRLRPP
jgi:hypothetical protein